MNNQSKPSNGSLWSIVKNWVVPIAIGVIIALLCEQFLVTTADVDGDSMQPNLENREKLMVWRQAKIKHLSVVVFDAHGESPDASQPHTYYVKRVIGMPGDTVSFKNNQVYVNGKQINQNFISPYQRSTKGTGYINSISPQAISHWSLPSLAVHWNQDTQSIKVPKGKYFVMGDHRRVSFDSRYWGFVPKNKILGVAKTFAWSTNQQKRHNVNSISY
ncbi:signal peptidase I [Philodulcilactobacillus myokoensis]|uniref:Signal peptidase I n=1 Tax=Philodulcilactobacillus myokoensis TaxID=2929573 RepID=A0A9W6ERZ0_9LACO|nr:signal peptidase I [Philodulcilactobacillus myokoensis]GLB46087.1 signal peptidase I [Philodulcilactobacillus myokoensis]